MWNIKKSVPYKTSYKSWYYQHCLEETYKIFLDLLNPFLKSLVVPVIWLAQIGAIYSQIAPFFAQNHIIFPAIEEVTLQTCGLSRRFREPLRYTVELSSNQK